MAVWVFRWIALVPAAVAGALVLRYLFYLVATSLFGQNLFTGFQVGAVFAFVLGYFATKIAPAHKRGVALVLLGLLGLFYYVGVGGYAVTLVSGGDLQWFDLGETVAGAAVASILLAELARGKSPFEQPAEQTGRGQGMPREGETKPCPRCEEEGGKGICTWTRWESTTGFVGDGGAIPDPVWVEEWQCDQSDQHHQGLNEP